MPIPSKSILTILGLAGLHAQTILPGSRELVPGPDLAAAMVDGIHRYLERETAAAADRRTGLAIPGNRDRFRKIIGAVDSRVPVRDLWTTEIAKAPTYRVLAIRWPVFEDLDAEGLLLEPVGTAKARVVALPDADQSPEMLAGLAPGIDPKLQFARHLAEQGCQVLIPVLIDRQDTWSGIPGIRMTNQPHREWIYRMAFEAGRHIVGYEVQKVLAGIDWFTNENAGRPTPIGVAGYGEGGLLALYAAALDTRISAALVSGYFQPRQELWNEPIYRDVWGLLREFGDAELAGMIAPRALVVDPAAAPAVSGPPPSTPERRGAAPVGAIVTPSLDSVRKEVDRARRLGANVVLASQPLQEFLSPLGLSFQPRDLAPATIDERSLPSSEARLHRQFDQLVAHTQGVIRRSLPTREALWAATSKPAMRDLVWNDVIGRMPDPSVPANPRTRLIFDEPKYRGYEVMLDVWPDVFAYGILLVPKDIRAGEHRPVVVCQHGLEGRPRDVADPSIDNAYYHRFAVRLAEEGFVTFAPQNPYIGEDRFRLIQRKAHPLKLSLFSFILGQHQRILEWLGGLPFVDSKRIGFYGLSYGGKTAVRVPPLLDGYALSICSADFNEWVWKTTSVDSKYSYMLTQEYDMLEFDFANVVNYSDLANLMADRPCMVERGHDDTVAPDEWVAYEYAKVRRYYTKLGIPERTAIEFFNGPHSIHGVGTFEFLRRHLHWPQ
jgi:dienelactone hydrolase